MSGTSAGAKKGWMNRSRKGGSGRTRGDRTVAAMKKERKASNTSAPKLRGYTQKNPNPGYNPKAHRMSEYTGSGRFQGISAYKNKGMK